MGSSIARLNDDFLNQRRQQSLMDAMYRTSPQPMVMEEDLEDMYGITPLLLNQRRDASYQDYLARPQISQPVSPTEGLQSIIDRNEAIMSVPVPPAPIPTPTPTPAPAPTPTPQGTETIAGLASRYNLSPGIVAQFSQQNKPRSGNDADPEPRPTFYGYSGDLSGLTGRYLSASDIGSESGPGRPETYADVLARARRAEQERGRD